MVDRSVNTAAEDQEAPIVTTTAGRAGSDLTHQRPAQGRPNAFRELALMVDRAADQVDALQAEIAILRARLQQATDRADYWHARAVAGPVPVRAPEFSPD